jgi:hypothetical protein
MIEKNKDFITLSRAGISILALGDREKSKVRDSSGMDKIVHSIESLDFLKVDKNNMMLFECAEEDRIVSIYQEYQKSS